jgi:hypothetical protein
MVARSAQSASSGSGIDSPQPNPRPGPRRPENDRPGDLAQVDSLGPLHSGGVSRPVRVGSTSSNTPGAGGPLSPIHAASSSAIWRGRSRTHGITVPRASSGAGWNGARLTHGRSNRPAHDERRGRSRPPRLARKPLLAEPGGDMTICPRSTFAPLSTANLARAVAQEPPIRAQRALAAGRHRRLGPETLSLQYSRCE